MDKFEYKVIVRDGHRMSFIDQRYSGLNGEEVLNMLGAEGWELVSVPTFGSSYRVQNPNMIHYILKRRIP